MWNTREVLSYCLDSRVSGRHPVSRTLAAWRCHCHYSTSVTFAIQGSPTSGSPRSCVARVARAFKEIRKILFLGGFPTKTGPYADRTPSTKCCSVWPSSKLEDLKTPFHYTSNNDTTETFKQNLIRVRNTSEINFLFVVNNIKFDICFTNLFNILTLKMSYPGLGI